MNITKFFYSFYCQIKYHIFAKNIFIGKHVVLKNKKRISFSENVHVCSNSILICGGQLKISNNVYIGFFSEIMACHKVEIEDNVIIGPYLFITDSNHEYRDINTPICYQGAPKNESTNMITIGKDTWIGAHVSIIGNVSIGKHCVIAANSVVVKDIPDYSVAAGVPAKVIKKYSFEKEEWIKV